MKNKGLSLFDIAQMEGEYVKDSVTDAFETLFSIIDELDGTLPLYESVEFDDSAFIPLYSSYSFIETALIHLDDLMDDILDSANRIYPLSKVDGIDKKEKKRIRDLSDSTVSAIDDFVSANDEVLDYFAERNPEQIRSSSLAPHFIETLENILPKCEEIVESYFDTAIWANPAFEDYYVEDDNGSDEIEDEIEQ